MKYALLIAWHEFIENAKTKGFWIGMFLFPVIIFMSIQGSVFLEKKGTPTRHFILADLSGQFEKVVAGDLDRRFQKDLLRELNQYANKNLRLVESSEKDGKSTPGTTVEMPADLREFNENQPGGVEKFIEKGGSEAYMVRLRPFLKPDAPKFTSPRQPYQRIQLPLELRKETNAAALVESLKPYLRGGKKIETDGNVADLYAAVIIPPDIDKQIVRPGKEAETTWGSGIQFWAGNLADTRLRDDVERSINSEVRKREFMARGLDYAAISQVQSVYAPFNSMNPKKETGKERVGMADVIRQWAPTGFVYLLWIAIFSIVQMLLNSTIEEKSNRLVEVLLSSVTPGELMAGKLIGISAIGMSMITAWMLALIGVLLHMAGAKTELAGTLFTILKTSGLLPAFGIYFILGFIMYAGVILSIGSVCNTIKEAQNYMGIITVFMMVPLLTMTFIPKDPNGTVATVLSWIPIYTPFVMMNRITADPPLRDLIGTMILLLASDVLILWLSGKIFRIGILRTGQPPKILEMIRWVRSK